MVYDDIPMFFQYNSLKIFTHPQVYEPAEDTFLLIESISINENQTVLEIGAGTGIIALSCAQKGATVICSDINPYAVTLIQRNINENRDKLKGSMEVRQGNLFQILNKDESFDIIIFNPPYLPTRLDEKVDDGGWFDIAVDGGKTGLETTRKFLSMLPKYLKSQGVGYYIFSTLADKKLLTTYIKDADLKDTVVSTLSFEQETLEVHKVACEK
ncbi:MAG: methyltransferase [Candidatus Thermoplasmatota archaeon]|nr:methyltransferase [Candidatus Thermoplasmatota archaeon]